MKKIIKYTLNVILAIICSVPVITLADSITAMHFVNFKLEDNPEINVPKEFFKSFKINLGQSIFLTIIFVLVGGFLGYRWYAELTSGDISKFVVIILAIVTFLFLMFESMSTYLLAKFDNPIKRLLLLVVFSIGSHIDCAAKMAFSQIFAIALTILIVIVNPGVISFTVAALVLFVALVLHQILSAKWIMPIYKTLLTTKEQGEQAAKEAMKQAEISVCENTDSESSDDKKEE